MQLLLTSLIVQVGANLDQVLFLPYYFRRLLFPDNLMIYLISFGQFTLPLATQNTLQYIIGPVYTLYIMIRIIRIVIIEGGR